MDDGDLDVRDEFAARAYEDFYPYSLERHGQLRRGRLNEPHGAGFPLLIAPAYALGGAKGVEVFLAALAALAVALGHRLALRVAPEPWASGAALAVGLSPPLLAYGTAVYPELPAGVALAGAALLALRLDAHVSRRGAFACFVLLGMLPWLGTKFLPAAVVVGYVAARGLWRARRKTLAIGAVELAAFSVALWIAVNEGLYGSFTPYSADIEGEGTSLPGRAYRLVALFIDRDYGLLRWAPVFALAFAGLWLLWRSHRDRLARAVPGVRDIELTAGMCAAALGAQLLVAAFLAPTMFGFWFPPRHLLAALPLAIPLCAWGLRALPRVGIGLIAPTVAASVWLYLDVRVGDGGLVAGRPDAPFGPLTRVFPLFSEGTVWPFALAGGVAAALAALVFFELRHSRQAAGTTRAKYSG